MAMSVKQVLHMNGGSGDTSYATNSKLQEKSILRTKPIVQDAIENIYKTLMPEKMVVADLGCSSGPNTFLVLTEVINVVKQYCHCPQTEINVPEILFFMNDLPGNDFNNLFQSLTKYEENIRQQLVVPHYVVGVPGSFYGRLFPSKSVHLFHSSYCLMWLSQVPEGIENNKDLPVNKGNIYISKTSPPEIVKEYQKQYRKDFSMFLRARFVELCKGGRMVLSFLGRQNNYPAYGELSHLWKLLADVLNEMVSEGVLQEEKLDTLNLPFYAPSMEEVKDVIKTEGLFDIDQAHICQYNWDPKDDSINDFVSDNEVSGTNTANCIRAVVEPIVKHHFDIEDATLLDELFSRYAGNISRHLQNKKTKHPIIVIALKTVG